MPIHEWSRVDPAIFHHFHQQWTVAITNVLNQRLLPGEYYALTEQQGGGFEPDVMALKSRVEPDQDEDPLEFYRRKQNVVSVRHVSGDHLVAIVEVVSKGNKSGRKAFDDFVRKAAEFLTRGVHLLVLDLQPPTARDPQGIHGAIWDEVAGEEYSRPLDKPMTLAAYEASASIRAFVEPLALGDVPIDMPLFLEPGRHVEVPIDETYRLAFEYVPRRWRMVLEPV